MRETHGEAKHEKERKREAKQGGGEKRESENPIGKERKCVSGQRKAAHTFLTFNRHSKSYLTISINTIY